MCLNMRKENSNFYFSQLDESESFPKEDVSLVTMRLPENTQEHEGMVEMRQAGWQVSNVKENKKNHSLLG